ncbi:hypothetical protein AWV80_41040 [Cupriavidus sp. UYMU48A]|nr:hypothetical protein AWV80_41040 [Cupriavidus sp. UYMU48A]
MRHIDAQQLQLNNVASHISQQDLVRWLDGELRQPDISGSTQAAAAVCFCLLLRGTTKGGMCSNKFRIS